MEHDALVELQSLVVEARRLEGRLDSGKHRDLAYGRKTRRLLLLRGNDRKKVYKWYKAWANYARAHYHLNPDAKQKKHLKTPIHLELYGLTY